MINAEYKMTPSKKGSFPKGVLMGILGSGTRDVCLNTRESRSIELTKSNNKSIISKAIKLLNGYAIVILFLNV